MKIIIIAAIGLHGELGKDNSLLWKLPDDMKFFSETTNGHTVIMGRKTYESIPKNYRPLVGRKNIVISSSKNYESEGAIMSMNFLASLGIAESLGGEKIFIIGGSTIYERAIKYADEMLITHVNQVFPNADVYFPDISRLKWEEKRILSHKIDEKHEYDFVIKKYINDNLTFLNQKLTDEDKLNRLGWSVTCQSPHELTHEHGSFASGIAADILFTELTENFEDYI